LPRFEEVKNQLSQLIEYLLFPYPEVSRDEVLAHIARFSQKEILSEMERVSQVWPTDYVLGGCCFISAQILKENAIPWVRKQWTLDVPREKVASLTAQLLPVEEGLDLATKVPPGYLVKYFPCQKAVDWIENHPWEPYTSGCGTTAAHLGLRWNTVHRWLMSGRPLSLVAMGALEELQKNPAISLKEPTSLEQMKKAISDYVKKDSTPKLEGILASLDFEKILSEKKTAQEYLPPGSHRIFREGPASSFYIKKFMKLKPNGELQTKLGGQPDWIQAPQWPISESLKKPMTFIGQIKLDPQIFPESEAKMAYLFISEFGDEYVDTFEYDCGENAVILQPDQTPEIEILNISTGPTLSETPYGVMLEMKDDAKLGEKQLSKSKIGGIPHFLQNEEYPSHEPWNLLLQLNSSDVPFEVNFGDDGTGYAFLSKEGKVGKFGFQSS
jgi:hypothetical protein